MDSPVNHTGLKERFVKFIGVNLQVICSMSYTGFNFSTLTFVMVGRLKSPVFSLSKNWRKQEDVLKVVL